MILKELEIFGFKSFSSKTQFNFKDSFTAIVGPNGCGKSNVLDAIKWVMGEKSVRSMRSDKMEDVIFSGTDTKNPSGFAYVHIIFDNTAKFFLLDTPEVKLSRKLFRDGQSNYFINDIKVPRKDLEGLLLDTGLGKDNYSFMQQGQMDMILSSKPEDRRYIFEEAAGISRFKFQREESLRKLEGTQNNITRLSDILHELERELTIKKSQSSKTEEYNKLIKIKNTHQLNVQYASIQDIAKSLANLNDKLEKKIHEREKGAQKILLLEENLLRMDEEKQQYSTELHEKDIHNKIGFEKITQWEKESADLIDRKKTIEKEMFGINERVEQIDNRIQSLKGQENAYKQLYLELDDQLENADNSIQKTDSQMQEKENQNKIARASLAEKRNAVSDKEARVKDLRTAHELAIQDLLEFLTSEKKKWSTNLESIDKNIAVFEKELREFINEFSSLENKSESNILLEIKNMQIKYSFSSWLENVSTYGKLEHNFWDKLFEKGGIHSRKEEMANEIKKTEETIDSLKDDIKNISANIETVTSELTHLKTQKESLVGDKKTFQVKQTSITEQEKHVQTQVEHEEQQLNYFTNKLKNLEKEQIQINSIDKKIKTDISNTKANIDSEVHRIENINKNLIKLNEQKEAVAEKIQTENNRAQDYLGITAELEIKIGTLLGSKEALLQEVYNDHNLLSEDLEKQFKNKRTNLLDEKNIISEVNQKIQELGPINPLATEEWETINSLYQHNKSQLEDITNAKKKIEDVIKEIQTKSEAIFINTFSQIQKNFHEVFRKLFNGGDVILELLEKEKPLSTGIDIQVQPPGKRARSLKLLSGGEKALTAIALMFSVYMVRSSPICILDEIDAPLDDQNVSRFIDLLEVFRDKTQFILITHNKKTMTKSGSIFGITMEEPGISKVLAVKIIESP